MGSEKASSSCVLLSGGGKKRKRECSEQKLDGESSLRIERGNLLLETGESEALTTAFSDDNILHILRHLPTRFLLTSSALVCRRWHRLCYSQLVWELAPSPLSPYKRPWGSLGEKEVLDLARLHASTLERVKLYWLSKLKADEIISVVRSLPKLRDFAVIPCHLIGFELEDLIRSLPHELRTLDLHDDHLITGNCEDDLDTRQPDLTEAVELIKTNCPKLQHLNLDFCGRISVDCLDGFLLTFQNICSLNLYSNTFGWPEVEQILKSCTRLESLSLVSTGLIADQTSSSDDDSFPTFGKRIIYPKRQVFPIYGSEVANFDTVMPKCLCSLRLYSSPHRSVPLDSSPVLALLKESGQQLHHLHAQSVYNTSWHIISIWCANIRILDLSHARNKEHNLTGIEEVILCGLPRLLKHLERIALPSVTDRILMELGRFCAKLKEIHIEGHGASGYGLQNQSKITDRGVTLLAEGCPNLQVLSLAGCVYISIVSLRVLAFHCKNLTVLLLTGCRKINGEAIAAIWPRFNVHLHVLDVTGCKVSSKLLKEIYDYSQMYGSSLKVLTVSRSIWKSTKADFPHLMKGSHTFTISHHPMLWDGFSGSQTQFLR